MKKKKNWKVKFVQGRASVHHIHRPIRFVFLCVHESRVPLNDCANHFAQCAKNGDACRGMKSSKHWHTTGQKVNIFVRRPLFHAVLNCFSKRGNRIRKEMGNVKPYNQSLNHVKGPSHGEVHMKPSLGFKSNKVIRLSCPLSWPI